jgi:hypothetical protein
MATKWRKLGQIFVAENQFPWMATHAAAPFAEQMNGDLYRIYFSPRGPDNRSCIASLIFDIGTKQVLEVERQPVLEPGELGMFDDSGCVVGYVLSYRGQKMLYYLGWNLKVTVPWLNTIGLAIQDGATGKFVKQSRAPVMDRSNEDPFSISYPSILEAGGLLKMWYGSNLSWGSTQEAMRHVIKTAYSDDGISWQRTGRVAIDLMHRNEFALSKPFVLKDGSMYEMWYSYRGRDEVTKYRIGYATSANGDDWTRRDDEAGIDVSADGWDSDMICYPCVIDHRGERFMFYNGNSYGATGFGLTVAE